MTLTVIFLGKKRKSFLKKVGYSIGAVFESIEFDIGIGMGLAGNLEVLGITVGGGLFIDLFHISSNEEVGFCWVGQYAYQGFEVGIKGASFGKSKVDYLSSTKSWTHEGVESNDIIIGVGGKAYFLFGANASIGINLTTLNKKWERIWG